MTTQQAGVGVQLDQEPRYQLWQQRWPGWTARFTHLWEGGESFYWRRKMILLDADGPDWRYQLAHAAAHMELHMPAVQLDHMFTDEQEQEAHELAEFWLVAYSIEDLRGQLNGSRGHLATEGR